MPQRNAQAADPDIPPLREGMRAILAAGLARAAAAHEDAREGDYGGAREGDHGGAREGDHGGAREGDHGGAREEEHGGAHEEARGGAHEGGHEGAYAGAHEAIAEALEAAAFAIASREAEAFSRRAYADAVRLTCASLPTQVGPYPDDVVALMVLSGRRSPEDTVASSLTPPEAPAPREVTRRLFVRTLMAADPWYAAERAAALETASAIETSCYNAAVRTSKESEEPPRRQWDSPAFVDIYSTRCGVICRLLDPSSAACRAYRATLAQRLRTGELAPGSLGDMTEKELCPQATAAERAEIAKRSQQKVVERESNLFRCPHCGERRSNYQEIQRRSLDEAPDYLCLCLNPKCRRRFTGRS